MKKNILIAFLILNAIGNGIDKYRLKKTLKEKDEQIKKNDDQFVFVQGVLKMSIATSEYWKMKSEVFKKMYETKIIIDKDDEEWD